MKRIHTTTNEANGKRKQEGIWTRRILVPFLRCVWTTLGLILAREVSAVPIASDGFDYLAGSIAGRNGGSGYSQAYSGNGQVNADSLQYTDSSGVALTTIGNHVSTTTSGSGIFRTLSVAGRPPGMLDVNNKFGADGSRVYIGFLERLDSGSVNSFGDYGGVSLFDGNVEHVFFGDLGFSGTHTFWGVDPQQGEAALRESGASVSSTVRLLIGRIDFAPGFETVRFYIDPPLNAEPAIPTLGPFTMHDFRFTRVRLEGGGNGRYSFDELALGSSYTDVVPEPSSAALVSASALTFLRRDKRIRQAGVAPQKE